MNKLLLNQRQQESTPQNNSNNNNCSLSPACFNVIRVSLPLSFLVCVCVCVVRDEKGAKQENRKHTAIELHFNCAKCAEINKE